MYEVYLVLPARFVADRQDEEDAGPQSYKQKQDWTGEQTGEPSIHLGPCLARCGHLPFQTLDKVFGDAKSVGLNN